MRLTVTAPDGRTWEVENRWYRHPARRRPDFDDLAGFEFIPNVDFDVGGIVGTIVVGLVLTVVLGALVVFLLPVLTFLAEIPIVLVMVFLVRRLWIVEARSGAAVRTWQVRGWRRSRRAVREVARELQLGVPAEPDEALRA
jgi:hypothetical protein